MQGERYAGVHVEKDKDLKVIEKLFLTSIYRNFICRIKGCSFYYRISFALKVSPMRENNLH